MGLEEKDLPIHAKRFKDGYPICWPIDKMGLFEGSFDEGEVTCLDCITYMKEI